MDAIDIPTRISALRELVDNYLKEKDEEQKHKEIYISLNELFLSLSNGKFKPNDLQKWYTAILELFTFDEHHSKINGEIIKCCSVIHIHSRAHIYKTDIFKTMDCIFQFSKLIEQMEKQAVSRNQHQKLRKENNMFFGPCLSFLLMLPRRVASCSCFELTGKNFVAMVDWCRELMVTHQRRKSSILQLIELCLPMLGYEEKLKLGNDDQFLSAVLSNSSSDNESEKKIFRDLSYISPDCCFYLKASKYSYGDIINQSPINTPSQHQIYSYETLRNAVIFGKAPSIIDAVSTRCFELLRAHEKFRKAEAGENVLYVERMYLMTNILVKKALHDDSLQINNAVKKLCFEIPHKKINIDIVKFINYDRFIKACLISKMAGPPAFGLLMIAILQKNDERFFEAYTENGYGPLIVRLMRNRSSNDIITCLIKEISQYFRYTKNDDLSNEIRVRN